jgi:hypothetical protein
MRWIFEAFRGRLKYSVKDEGLFVRKWRSEFGRGIVRPTIEVVRKGLSEEDAEYAGEIYGGE